MLAEFDHLNIQNYYETIEISVLGHYLPSSIQNIKNFIDFLLLKVFHPTDPRRRCSLMYELFTEAFLGQEQ